MILKSFGCSYVFGSELSDMPVGIRWIQGPPSTEERKLYASGSRLTWPVHLANHLGYQSHTHARPGSGNLQILERLMSNMAGPPNDHTICVIGWTWIDRFDFCMEKSDWPGLPWNTLHPVNNTETSKIYYRDLHTEIKDKLVSLMHIRQAIDFLKEKSIPFIMTYMDDLLFDTRWNINPAITELQNYVKPYMTTFEGLSFVEWSRKNEFPISYGGHPLDQAHQAAGEYMIKVFDTKSIGAHCHPS